MSAIREEALNALDAQLRLAQGSDVGGSSGVEGSVANVANADALIGSILRRDANLSTVVLENEKRLKQLSDGYVAQHVANADDVVRWYNDISQCEDEIKAFEESILGYQSQLTNTAEGIVKMQQETLKLMKRVENRRVVSQRLKLVYDALNETEEFCQSIALAPAVDEKFMQNIRQLESKIAFLADDPQLQGSAVHQEIHPKLQASALKAGDKLHQYLLKRFHGLSEEGTNVALVQQAMERQGQYSYSFLARYNPAVASDLASQYVRIVSEVHLRNWRTLERDLAEVAPFSSVTFEPIMRNEFMQALHTNHDGGVPGGGVALPARGPSSARSVSTSTENRFRTVNKVKEERREASFTETLQVVKSIGFEPQLHLDPVVAVALKSTTSFASRFADLMCHLVNSIGSEAKFLSQFFFNGTTSDSTDGEEGMLRGVTAAALESVIGSLQRCISEVTDVAVVVAAERVLELAKNCTTQIPNPLPILVLAGLFEAVGGALQKRAAALLMLHKKSLEPAAQLKLQPIKQGEGNLLSRIEADPKLAKALRTPHEVTVNFARYVGEVEVLNSLPLKGSRVSTVTARHVFDDRVAAGAVACYTEYHRLLENLAKRHSDPVAERVVKLSNLGFLLTRARQMQEAASSPTSPLSPDAAAGEGASPITSVEVFNTTPLLVQLQKDIRADVAAFVAADVATTPLQGWFETIGRWRTALGEALEERLLASTEIASDSAKRPAALDPQAIAGIGVKEEELTTAGATFNKEWKATMSGISSRVRSFLVQPEAAPAAAAQVRPSTFDNPRDGTALLVAHMVLEQYFQAIIDRNRALTALAKDGFPSSSGLQAKLVSNVTLTHQAAHELRSLGV